MGTHSDYVKAHKHLGRADAHSCARCGGPAHQWAYQYTDPEPLQWGETVYSHDPQHYAPMCRSCHIAFDKEMDPRQVEVARRRAQACGDGAKATMEEMMPTYVAAGRKAAAMRRECSCGRMMSPGSLALHQRATGHEGKG